ncbi:uncharacterized protein LOC143636872 [Bidens hawaiensis]|uniref:uncharacterized protein LOC143636872 n=1 Tax=Bidens hawaiensis TaxID=980011 RepID=UPI00404A252D
MDIELHDWEVLDDSNPVQTTAYLDGIERDSEGIIKSDYFSLDSHKYHLDDVTDQLSVESDNPSWIDPVCDTSYSITKPVSEASSTDESEFVASSEVGCDEAEIELKPQEIGEESVDSGEVIEGLGVGDVKAAAGGGGDEIEKSSVVAVWWKLPVDLLKYCLFKASPVWTFSVAAAMMGVVILGRRLYKMKQKTRALQLKVAVDDKKVSQVMSRAARLNEAFSVVKRVPIIRPSLPAAGITPWPVMALR